MALDNPVASLAFNIPCPEAEDMVYDRWETLLMSKENMRTYGITYPEDPSFSGSQEPFSSSSLPEGQRSIYFYRMERANGTERPAFVSQSLWPAEIDSGYMRNAPSGFLSGNGSLMPKLIVTSDLLFDNGVKAIEKWRALTSAAEGTKSLFNWDVLNPESAAVITDKAEVSKALQLGSPVVGSRHVSLKTKDESFPDPAVTEPVPSLGWLRLDQLGTEGPTPNDRWMPNELVLSGAFCIFVNMVPLSLSKTRLDFAQKMKSEVVFEFGEVTMTLGESGSLLVTIGNTTTRVQLVEASASEGPSQSLSVKGVKKYLITVYPVWNGIVVSSGIQDVANVRDVSSVFCPKTPGANVMMTPYLDPPFDPQDPDDIVEVEYASFPDVVVNMGTKLDVKTTNCRIDLAYIPCFFSKVSKFDIIFVGSKDTDSTTGMKYQQRVFPIWSKNGNSDAILKINGSTDPDDWNAVPLPSYLGGPLDFPNSGGKMEYRCITVEIDMKSENNTFSRYAPEILGFYMRYREIDDVGSVSNPNSVPGEPFDVTWTGGTHGDPEYTGSWQDYIQSINVSLGLDGSTATIIVDKYGCAGWNALVNQSIGAITIDIAGGPFPERCGRIFSGLAFGVGDSGSADSNTWTIQCYGLERKLQEILLILPPFFDGMTVNECTRFLCRYAGIYRNFDNFGSPDQHDVKLGSSSRSDSPKYNFATGTSVNDALMETMNNSSVVWICQPDGVMHLYSLNPTTSLPKVPHTDYSSSYPYASIMSTDLQPDFEDLRNEIVTIALRDIGISTGATPDSAPVMPYVLSVENTTVPEFPWSKRMVMPFKGVMTAEEQQLATDRLKTSASKYELIGKTQITGDARIWPYSSWGSGVVVSAVSHSVDFINKTWTTDLEFSKSGT